MISFIVHQKLRSKLTFSLQLSKIFANFLSFLRLFESVARSCMVKTQQQPQQPQSNSQNSETEIAEC